MSSGSYKQVDVLCPFYHSDDGKHRIICEGVVDHGNLTLFFNRKSEYNQHITHLCSESYSECEVNKMLMQKYEEDDECREKS